jgi:hypothetical protein
MLSSRLKRAGVRRITETRDLGVPSVETPRCAERGTPGRDRLDLTVRKAALSRRESLENRRIRNDEIGALDHARRRRSWN